MTKKCYKCKNVKELNNFYHNKKAKDNHRNICKDCEKKRLKEYRKTERYKMMAKNYKKKYRKTKKGKISYKKEKQKYHKRNLFKERARIIAYRKIPLKKFCENCGQKY